MAISSKECAPYVSMALFRDSKTPISTPDDLLNEAKKVVRERAAKKEQTRPSFPSVEDASIRHGELQISWCRYVEKRSPAWYQGEGMTDVRNQIIVIVQKGQVFAFVCSDSSLRDELTRSVTKAVEGAFASITKLAPKEIENAFVQDQVRTLWLSGAHRRTAIKADAKTLSGIELESAIDPLGDQSYYFSSIRSTLSLDDGGDKRTIGASPIGNRIWLGPSSSWDDFIRDVANVLDRAVSHSKQETPRTRGLSVLASPTTAISGVEQPYDIALIVPEEIETGNDTSGDDDTRWLQQFADSARFKITGKSGSPDFEADVFWDGVRLGRISYKFDELDSGRVRLRAKRKDGFKGGEKDQVILRLCKKPEHVSIYFDTGHTFSRGHFYESRFRDARFEDWEWAPISNHDFQIGKEKPTDGQKFAIDRIGLADDKSLFGFVVKHWPHHGGMGQPRGWLVCDDGSMESADFIHIDLESVAPVVTLIHAKGSGSSEANRPISVADYEVVVSQAVKNIRHLDKDLLFEKLSANADTKLKDAVWYDGDRQSDRSGVLEVLNQMSSNFRKRVCILQPRVRQSLLDDLRSTMDANQDTAQVRRLRQLDALLLGARANCFSVGADFTVVADNDG